MRLAWSAYLKHKGTVAMEQPFGLLSLDEEMPERGTIGQGAHRHPTLVTMRAFDSVLAPCLISFPGLGFTEVLIISVVGWNALPLGPLGSCWLSLWQPQSHLTFLASSLRQEVGSWWAWLACVGAEPLCCRPDLELTGKEDP